jgi:hypothetical protein
MFSLTNESNLLCSLLGCIIDPFYLDTLARLEALPSSSLFILLISPLISLRIFSIQGCSKILEMDGRCCG